MAFEARALTLVALWTCQDDRGPPSLQPDLLPKLLTRLAGLAEEHLPGPAPGLSTILGTTDATSLLRHKSIGRDRRFAHSEAFLSGVFRSQLSNVPKLGPLSGVMDIGAGRGMQNIREFLRDRASRSFNVVSDKPHSPSFCRSRARIPQSRPFLVFAVPVSTFCEDVCDSGPYSAYLLRPL